MQYYVHCLNILSTTMKQLNTGMFFIYLIYSIIIHTNGQMEMFVNASISRQNLVRYLTNTSRYEAAIAPDFNKEKATEVRVQITIGDIHTISETSMDYSIDIFLRQLWHDERLDFTIYNTTFDKLEIDPNGGENIWHPDTYFHNEKKASIHTVTTPNELLHIYRNGTVVFSMRLAMTLTCTMLLHKYPFDSQTCPIQLSSYGYTIDNIDLIWREFKPVYIDKDEVPQFYVSRDVTTNKEITNHQTGTFSSLQAEIQLHRKMEFFIIEVFVPTTLLVALSWVSFWVDSNAVPARVTLGVTCVLTMTTHSSGIRQSLPPVSYVKAIDVWMCVCLLFVFAALLEFAYVNVLQRSDRRRHDKQNTRLVVNDIIERRCDVYGIEESDVNAKRGYAIKWPCFNDRKMTTGEQKAKQVDMMSRIVFPVLFIVFLVTFSLFCAFAPNPSAEISMHGV